MPSRVLTRRTTLAAVASILGGCVTSDPRFESRCSDDPTAWSQYRGSSDRNLRVSRVTPARIDPAPSPSSDSSTSTSASDTTRSTQSPTRERLPSLDRVGAVAVDGGPKCPPAVVDSTAVVGVNDGVVATDLQTGNVVWEYRPGGPNRFNTTPVVHCGTVLASSTHRLHALDFETGNRRWRHDVSGGLHFPRSPAVVDGRLFVPGDGLVAVDARTGETLWQRTDFGHVAAVAASADHVIASLEDRGTDPSPGVAALDPATGETVWRRTNVGPVDRPAVVSNGRVGVTTESDSVWLLDETDGETVTSVLFLRPGRRSPLPPPTLVDDGAVAIERRLPSGVVRRIDEHGDTRWETEVDGASFSPIVGHEYVAVAGSGGLHLLDRETGTVEHTAPLPVGNVTRQFPVVPADGRLFVPSHGQITLHDWE
ncbi:PQQ-binding-like beta-propeller repeat protein [Halobaculum sp. MBLA0147]|uniref:outer membrane protein assembly factor BamB family protein n=1 Tax=Halobaculum sp. MBLA0147 TaxID=3079934 RepID=UPI003526C041